MSELSILDAANEVPDRACLVEHGRVFTFAEVAERVEVALGSLFAVGVETGQRVALAPMADLDSAIWLFALFELGCPALLLDPRLSDREREQLLRDADAAHVIGNAPPRAGPPRRPSFAPAVESTLAIVYTSGTGGPPRGARLSRRAFIASEAAHAAHLGWEPDDRWLLRMPPAHVGGLSILTRSLIARSCVVLQEGPFDAEDTLATLERDHVTLLSVVPTMLGRLLRARAGAWTPPAGLRAVLVGGASWPASLREESSARGLPALATYGCTEACSQVTTQALSDVGQPGSGRPLPGIEVRIVDGEIQVRGDTLMDGYVGVRVEEQPLTDDGWLRTGDLGAWLADGALDVIGRLDDRIVTGGEKVMPGEVESWLRTVPGIADACVFGVPDVEWGHAVAAVLVVQTDAFSIDLLCARMRDSLAPHKRLKRVAFLDALPLNRSGKVDRDAVRAHCAEDLRPISR